MSAAPTDTANTHEPEPSGCSLDLTEPFVLGDWRIDPGMRTASSGNTVVKIDPRNMRVLQILVERHGQIVLQRDLETLAWEGVVVTPDSLYQSIRQLRQALQDTKAPAKYIETVPRRGYRMVAEPQGILQMASDGPTLSVERRENLARRKKGFFSIFATKTALSALLATSLVAILAVTLGRTRLAPESGSEKATDDSSPAMKSVASAEALPVPSRGASKTSFRMLRALGYDALRAGKAREAIEYFERALQRQTSEAGERTQLGMEVLTEIANAYMWLDEEAVAKDAAAKALSIADQLGPSTSPERIVAVATLVDTLIALGDYTEADRLITDAVARARSYFGNDNAFTYRPVVSLASLRYAQGRLFDAEQMARDVVANATRARGAHDLHTAHAKSLLSAVLIDLGKFSDAEREARAVIDIANRHSTDQIHPYETSATHLLAEALLQQGDNSRAELLLVKELAALKETEATDWRIARASSVLGEVYLREGRLQDAERCLLLAKTKLTRTKGWPIEREARNLARRLEELDALRPKQVSALTN